MPDAPDDPLIRDKSVANDAEIESLGIEYQALFSVLREAGFDLIIESFAPESFGNFIVTCHRNDATLRVINDRGETFIDVKSSNGEWLDKERILAAKGVARSRYGTEYGLWLGYQPAVQAAELEAHLPLLISAASAGDQVPEEEGSPFS